MIHRAARDGQRGESPATLNTVTAVGKHGAKRHGVRVERGKIWIG